ncbi:NUDIX hydrolase [Wenyingzhuangia sp. IMCC45533]
MYKVFINEIPVFFTDNDTVLDGFKTIKYQELDFHFFVSEIQENPSVKINVICENLPNDWLSFLENFEVREAAGGVVQNKSGSYLWIHRFGKWDLPKGHIEKGESKELAAMREVEEECNVSGLVIDKPLPTTYHVFFHQEKNIMKVTYWFKMYTHQQNQELIPQEEEGITEVYYKTKEESLKCLSNTYKNIKLLLLPIL